MRSLHQFLQMVTAGNRTLDPVITVTGFDGFRTRSPHAVLDVINVVVVVFVAVYVITVFLNLLLDKKIVN